LHAVGHLANFVRRETSPTGRARDAAGSSRGHCTACPETAVASKQRDAENRAGLHCRPPRSGSAAAAAQRGILAPAARRHDRSTRRFSGVKYLRATRLMSSVVTFRKVSNSPSAGRHVLLNHLAWPSCDALSLIDCRLRM
jgi:hypothetical protein